MKNYCCHGNQKIKLKTNSPQIIWVSNNFEEMFLGWPFIRFLQAMLIRSKTSPTGDGPFYIILREIFFSKSICPFPIFYTCSLGDPLFQIISNRVDKSKNMVARGRGCFAWYDQSEKWGKSSLRKRSGRFPNHFVELFFGWPFNWFLYAMLIGGKTMSPGIGLFCPILKLTKSICAIFK